MVIVMKMGASDAQVQGVVREVEAAGFRPFINPGVERKVIAVLGEVDIDKAELADQFSELSGVERVQLISEPFKLSSRSYHPEDRVVDVKGVRIGATERVVIMAGPCSIESRSQVLEVAHAVKESGARMLRGGAFKPRTSPHSFQGLGEEGLELLAEAREETGLPVVTEVMDAHDVPLVARYSDMLQIGARNMQNFTLLKRAGESNHPVLLKRGMGSKIKELLMAAEYILAEGNHQLVLCERGITTFEDSTRNTTDINAVPVLKHASHLPVLVDPSHATGSWRYVPAVARAGVAAGADGLLIEVHNDPAHAKSDGPQSLKPEKFAALMDEIRRVAEALGRTL
ncbi:MAG TPA: 3-deoxy-7-phosphoheptulonate synthase [Chloroflexota bacterium]|jgi:3-deoxy-7-phosphoheptulonate synthase|nr:3-deoxy-7-phosphoheptulonate synthase [Chloroflexota bacterium]